MERYEMGKGKQALLTSGQNPVCSKKEGKIRGENRCDIFLNRTGPAMVFRHLYPAFMIPEDDLWTIHLGWYGHRADRNGKIRGKRMLWFDFFQGAQLVKVRLRRSSQAGAEQGRYGNDDVNG
jgi:hypothetical protein